MNYVKIFFFLLATIFVAACASDHKGGEETQSLSPGEAVKGEWIRQGPGGMASLTFKEDNHVEIDMKMDGEVDVVSEYKVNGNRIEITDVEGQTCPGAGKYEITYGKHFIGLDMVMDSCFGRVRAIMGFWTRPDYADIIIDLDDAIKKTSDPELILERARVYVAIGKAPEARADFEAYVKTDSTDAYVFMNLAGTCFPQDIPGVIKNCTRALELNPNDKNSYFMRGLARYDLGQREEACDDIQRAIELGFNFIAPAISSRCNEFWDQEGEE